ncbi:conserved hypothetical protein [Parvibaculum lavamentivorans DS-1]|uniref:DUF4282 domain-containing protein n=1 Tax=Parvibaculum lavamentivorans (strain DS-1 / DSM 13023 / NCIMB 13966) TaxID=402881 RepID=A7HP31_PARL1|nr:DUF4282 domain-containing protein [Parvibaculum lavamentivorans]ABS61664.1 conserved hypothetical protein [Parvibaculum lavamentivorans DS-1]
MRFQDFLTFDKLIAGSIVKFLYWLGVVIILLFGFGTIAGSINTMGYNAGLGLLQLVVGLVGVAFGILLWRVVCEIYLIFVAMNDKLGQIRDKLPGA